MFDVNGHYDLYWVGDETLRIAEVFKGKLYHVRRANNEPYNFHEYTLNDEGLFDLEGRLVAKWDNEELVRLSDEPNTRFKFVPKS